MYAVFKCGHFGVCVLTVELHGKHAVLRDDFDSNKQGELDPNIWWVEKVITACDLRQLVFPVSAGL